ncbi:MAG: hypothetical protein U0939_09205 [Pirellulales bacterium]
MPLDEELIAGLKQAKTQPRHFALVAKGTATLHAIVRRKAIKDGELLKAKTEFKGNATFQGVVQFDGEAYVFSFTEDPGLGLVKLRTYLIEQSGLNLKVACKVVPALPGVPDAEDESGAVEGGAGESGDSSAPSSTGAPPPPPPPPPPSDDRKNRLVETLKKVFSAAQQAIAVAADRKTELMTGLADAKAAIAGGQFDQAAALLKSLSEVIQAILAGGDETDEVELEEDALLDSLFPDDPDEQEQDETAEGESEAGATDSPTASEPPLPPPPPVPPTAKSPGVGGRLQWERVKEEVADRLSQLQGHLRQQKDPGLQRIGEVGFHSITGQLQVGLRVALMEFDRAAKKEDREKFRKQALEIIGKYQEFIKTNPLLKKCDENPFGIKLDARASLRTALDALAASLQA